MTEQLGWDKFKEKFDNHDRPLKYLITDDKEEFIVAMERMVERHFKDLKDNLRYLEDLERIRLLKAGAEPKDVYPWMPDR